MIHIALLTAALIVGACAAGPTPPVDPARALHFQSRLTQAVAVEVGTRGGGIPAYTTALRPCGSVVLVPGLSGVPASDLLITLLLDPTGVFDAQLAQFTGDPHDLAGGFTGLSILWSSGDIQPAGLPRWITLTPESVIVEVAPPAAQRPCAPWVQG